VISGWTHDELVAEAVSAPRRPTVPLPDLRRIERPGWLQLITPSFRNGGFNEVAHAVLDAATADATIAATIAEYRALGIKFRWTVGPDSAPADLRERLARHGLVESQSLAMVRALAVMPVDVPDVTVTAVTDEAELAQYDRVMAEGWNVELGPLALANRLALAMPSQRLYLARYRGEPAGVAGAVLGPRSVYLLGAVVLPAFRRHGLYRALVARRMADAHRTGATLAVSHARGDSSAPLLARMGFTSVCELAVFHG
jgi:GNAT superfamily N-acetyltransferase